MYYYLESVLLELHCSDLLRSIKPVTCREALIASQGILDRPGVYNYLSNTVLLCQSLLKRYKDMAEFEVRREQELEAKRLRVEARRLEQDSLRKLQNANQRKITEALNNQILVRELEKKEFTSSSYVQPRLLRRNSGTPLPSISPISDISELRDLQKEMDFVDYTAGTSPVRAAPVIPDRPPIIPSKVLQETLE